MANVQFQNLQNGISATLGDELNARLNVLKAAVNATPTPRGDWIAATNYVAADLVRFNGEQWLALRANTNVAPVEGLDWFLFAARGEAGSAGADIRDGDGVPLNSLGEDGGYYFDNLTGDYYKKINGAYQFRASLKGAKGDKGDKGDTGDAGGIVSTLARGDVTVQTGNLAVGATASLAFPLGRISILIRVTATLARVRLYNTIAQRDADLLRPIGTKPQGDHGLIWEGVTSVGADTIKVRNTGPAVNDETPPTANIAASITNLGAGARDIAVTIIRSTVQQ